LGLVAQAKFNLKMQLAKIAQEIQCKGFGLPSKVPLIFGVTTMKITVRRPYLRWLESQW